MGRRRVKLELISNEKSRITAFKNKKKALMKKLDELTTLCDVKACAIIYSGNQEKADDEAPEVWPQNNAGEIHRLIDAYKNNKRSCCRKTDYGLSDFLQERKRKIEQEVASLRKKNAEAKYPTEIDDNDLLNGLTEEQLRGLAEAMGNKLDYVKSRIERMKREQEAVAAANVNGDVRQLMVSDHHHHRHYQGFYYNQGRFEVMWNAQEEEGAPIIISGNDQMGVVVPMTTLMDYHQQQQLQYNLPPLPQNLQNYNVCQSMSTDSIIFHSPEAVQVQCYAPLPSLPPPLPQEIEPLTWFAQHGPY